jgi:DNA processing protein
MTTRTPSTRTSHACSSCLRRSWLLAQLSGPLDYCARQQGRLLELLALDDADLLAAAAGRRTSELRALYERFDVPAGAGREDMHAICRHAPSYPAALDSPASPHMLHVFAGGERLAFLTARPVIAIVGSRRASDYGWEMARSLARGLAASGVTVAASLLDGIASAAHAGALDAAGASIVVLGHGLGIPCPGRRRGLYERIRRDGCAVSELPPDCRGRRWGQLASERILVELATITVVVEAEDTPGDLAGARIAQALGRPVAAIPGRVTSPLSRGTHALLMEGASLVRAAQDVLELLCHVGASPADPPAMPGAPVDGEPPAVLTPSLRATLERVGAGCDTPDRLTRAGEDPQRVLLALSELELMGLLARANGGRYVPRGALTP